MIPSNGKSTIVVEFDLESMANYAIRDAYIWVLCSKTSDFTHIFGLRLSPTGNGWESGEAVREPHGKENRNHTPSPGKISIC